MPKPKRKKNFEAISKESRRQARYEAGMHAKGQGPAPVVFGNNRPLA